MLYRFLLGTLLFNDPYDKNIDHIITTGMISGIHKISGFNEYYLKITFNNGLFIEVCNANKYYAWMYQGTAKDLTTNKTIYSWNSSRPSAKIMYKMKKLINKIYLDIKHQKESAIINSLSVFNTIQNSTDLDKVYSEIKNNKYGNFSMEK